MKLTATPSAIKIARERKSSVLASNAVHHRIDCLTSAVALVAIGGSHVLSGASWLDPTGGLLVSLMVIRAGWTNTRAALLELADVGIDEEFKGSVRKAATKALSAEDAFGAKFFPKSDMIALRNVQGIKAGQNYLVEVELAVPGSWTVDETRKVEDAVREWVGSKVRGVRRVKVRFVANSNELPDFSDEFIGTDISPRTSPEPEDEEEARQERHGHDHRAHSESQKSR